MVNNNKDVIQETIKIDDGFIQDFKKDQLEFIKKSPFKKLEGKVQKIIEEIYFRANGGNLNGRDAKEFSNKVKELQNDKKYNN